MTLRQACNIAYAMHVRNMDGEQLENFNAKLYGDMNGNVQRGESIRERSRGMGQPIRIPESNG